MTEANNQNSLEAEQAENLEQVENNQADNQSETATETPETADMSPEQLVHKVEQLQAILEDYQNRLLRMQADFDNFRRRSKQEREDLVKFASEGLVCKLLPILDNFDRALTAEGDNSNMLAGVQMIHRQLVETLTSEGLEVMATCGCEFDPNLHQAVMMEPSEEVADNHVIAEFQKGYLLRGKVLRPAMVKVAQN